MLLLMCAFQIFLQTIFWCFGKTVLEPFMPIKPFEWNWYVDRMNEARTYVFSSPTMQMADSSFTTSVIMADWVGSIALASNERLFSSPRIRSKPYCSKHKNKTWSLRYAVILSICHKKTMSRETVNLNHITLWTQN